MKLSRTTSCQLFKIMQPRWKDRTVLLAKYRVGTHNEIVFTKTPTLPDHYYISGVDVVKYPVVTNGKIDCYAVDMNQLQLLERE